MKTYPSHQWNIWKFNRVSEGFWDKLSADFKELLAKSHEERQLESEILGKVKQLVDEVGKTGGVQKLEDWYQISPKAIGIHRWNHLKQLGPLEVILKTVYPSHEWRKERFHITALNGQHMRALYSQKRITNRVNSIL